MDDNIKKAIADLQTEIETVRRRLRMFEARDLKVLEDTGQLPLRDNTDEAVAMDKRLIERADRAIALLKAM